MRSAYLVIDLQNDYFPGGKYPLWNTDDVLANTERAISAARAKGMPVILVQHVGSPQSPFFQPDTEGVQLHPHIRALAPNDPVVVKTQADAFLKTNLEQVLADLGVDELVIGGMMTQNCVTHTAISKAAEKYRVTVLSDCCTTVDVMIHRIALNALSARVTLKNLSDWM